MDLIAICLQFIKVNMVIQTPTLSTNADSWTDTNLKRLRDLSFKKIRLYDFFADIFFLRGCMIFILKEGGGGHLFLFNLFGVGGRRG